jgi:hypothetical protein
MSQFKMGGEDALAEQDILKYAAGSLFHAKKTSVRLDVKRQIH